MAHDSDPRFVVAHAVRVKGWASVTAVAEVTGLDASEVAALLEAMHVDGLARPRSGTWSLTVHGRAAHRARCARDLRASGSRDAVGEAYRTFVALNGTFLDICTGWQLRGRPHQLNDHRDAAYDARLVARLGDVDTRIQPAVAALSDRMRRFDHYGLRLARARRRVESGQRDWFTGAMIDSYHTVWFELHEDLLATLGLERAKEAS